MAGPKLFPTHLHEIRRWLYDRGKRRQLKRPEGRTQYWNDLARQCANRSLNELLESTLNLRGDVIECGVYRGASQLQIAHTIKSNCSDKRVYGLDSFEGFPEDSVSATDVGAGRWLSGLRRKFRFCADTPGHLDKIAAAFGLDIELVPGYFCNTLPRFQNHSFCFIHLDVDIYQSYKECLEALYDRLVPGGVIVFDEWDCAAWPGATLAIKEFFSNLPEEVQSAYARRSPANYVRKLPANSLRRIA
jgi:predicted O-methyltransferase YrrM